MTEQTERTERTEKAKGSSVPSIISSLIARQPNFLSGKQEIAILRRKEIPHGKN